MEIDMDETNYVTDPSPALKGKNEQAKNGTVVLYTKTKKGGTKQLKSVQVESDGDWDIDIPKDDDGKHRYALKFMDENGNESDISDFFTVFIDSGKPYFSPELPQTLTLQREDPITFPAQDKMTDIKEYQVQLYDANGYVVRKWKKQDDSSYFLPQDLPLGTYTLKVRVYDEAENREEGSILVTFVQESLSPTVSEAEPLTQQAPQTPQTTPTEPQEEILPEPEPTPEPTPQTFQPQGRGETPQEDSCTRVWWNPFTWGC
jgi:hypothetical protein